MLPPRITNPDYATRQQKMLQSIQQGLMTRPVIQHVTRKNKIKTRHRWHVVPAKHQTGSTRQTVALRIPQ
jgi:hypothetical protein